MRGIKKPLGRKREFFRLLNSEYCKERIMSTYTWISKTLQQGVWVVTKEAIVDQEETLYFFMLIGMIFVVCCMIGMPILL